ncbi:MAG: alpha/beta fold hydrolase, partial [Geminicoccaceae bacterium]|nr:alpha/beta fold hydrolase [Geminicoccaceae bacterium]
MRGERIEFPNPVGERLAALLNRPEGPTRAVALFAHCFTCSKDVFAARRISEALAGRGIAVLRFDFTGLGASEGEFANTNFSSNVEDLVAAAGWLRDHLQAPAILIGHSLGGAAVLAAAGRIEEAVAVATIAAPFEPAHVGHLFDHARPEIESRGAAAVTLAGRSFTVTRQFLDDLQGQRQAERIQNLRKALLVFHAPRDEIVGIDNAGQIFQAARHPKSFVSLDDADHLLTRRADAAYVAEVLAAWASRYLPEVIDEREHAPGLSGEVVVWETGGGAFQQEVSTGRHRFIA